MQAAVVCGCMDLPEIEIWPQDISTTGKFLDVREQNAFRTLRASAEQFDVSLLAKCDCCKNLYLPEEVYKCGGVRCGRILCKRCYDEWPEVFVSYPQCVFCGCRYIEFEYCLGMYSALLDCDKLDYRDACIRYLSEPEVQMVHHK